MSTYIQFYTDSDSYHLRGRDELRLKETAMWNGHGHVECITIECTSDIKLACENSRPSLLPARVAFRVIPYPFHGVELKGTEFL